MTLITIIIIINNNITLIFPRLHSYVNKEINSGNYNQKYIVCTKHTINKEQIKLYNKQHKTIYTTYA